jgi:uncharacterized protein
MKQQLIDFIESKVPGSQPLLLVVRGSHAYGTNIETSDTDYAGVFVQSMDDILGFSYKEQINDDTNDTVIYEVRRFLKLIESNNPTVLELLNTPEDCIIYKHPLFNEILKHRDEFITKMCSNSFGGYAKQQISKARGQNKKQNWEKDKVTRKTPLDFCYVIGGNREENGSKNLVKWLEEKGKDQSKCGLVNVDSAQGVYALYIPHWGVGPNVSGIIKEGSNELRLSSIRKGLKPDAFISYNQNGYTKHCKDYASYEKWLSERNEARWVDVKSHGQKIDGKNMMHCRRLMDMAMEIAEGKGINVRRHNASDLIDIRKGKIDLKTLIDDVERDMKIMDEKFKNSDLPNSVDFDLLESILLIIRRGINN